MVMIMGQHILADDHPRRRQRKDQLSSSKQPITRSQSFDAVDLCWNTSASLDGASSSIDKVVQQTSTAKQQHKSSTSSASSHSHHHQARCRERHHSRNQYGHRRSRSCDTSNTFNMSGSNSEYDTPSKKSNSSSNRRSSSGTEKPLRNSESSSRHHSSSKDRDESRQRSTRISSSSGGSDHHHSRSSKGHDDRHNTEEGKKSSRKSSSSSSSKQRSSPESSSHHHRNSTNSEEQSFTPSSKHHRDRHNHPRDRSREQSPEDKEHRQRRSRRDESPSRDKDNDSLLSPSGAASKRREAAQSRGTEILSPRRQKEVELKHGSPGKNNHQSSRRSSRDASQTPSHRRPTLERTASEVSGRNLSSRTRSSQLAEKRSHWKGKRDGSKAGANNSNFDDAMDEKLQRRQSMLETSKKGIIRATASRTRAAREAQEDASDAFDDDDDDDCSVYSSASYLTTDSELMSDPHISVAIEMQRRQSCSYLPSALGTACPVVTPKVGRRASAFGNSQERAKAVYNDNDSDSSDEESVSSKTSNYIPTRLSKNCNFELDRADQFSARRPSMSGSSVLQLTVPIVDAPTESSSSVPMRTLRRSSTNTSSGSINGSSGGSSFANRRGSTSSCAEVDAPSSRALRRASTMGGSCEASKHDKGIEDILKSRRLRGDNSLGRNRYAQEEKEEERGRLVEPLKMLSTVGTAGIKGLTTVTNVGIQGVCTVGNAGLNVSKQTAKGISTVGTASIKGVSAVGNAGLKGVSTVGTASIKGVSAVGNVGRNVTKQTAKSISTVSERASRVSRIPSGNVLTN